MRAVVLRWAAVVVGVGGIWIAIALGPTCLRFADGLAGTAYCQVSENRIAFRIAVGVFGVLLALGMFAFSYPPGAPKAHPKATLYRWLS